MNLLAPGFLYALAVLAVPVIIHLFQFRRVRKVYFSNTRFLEQVKQLSQTKRRLKHLLILLCRLAFLTFLILTFAQPYLPGDFKADARLVDIYLDNSYSMSNTVEEGLSAFESGIEYASSLVQAYPRGTRFRLLTNNFSAAEQYYYSADVLEDKLTELQLSGRSRQLKEVIERLKVLPAREKDEKRDVFLLSDLQSSGWDEQVKQRLAEDSLNRYFFVPFQYEQQKNVYVDSVYLEKPYFLPGLSNTLMVRLANTGSSTAETPLKLSINSRQVASTTVSVPAAGKELVQIPLNLPLQKFNQAQLELTDYPISFDNDFYFVLRKEEPVQVLELKATEDLTPIGRVFGDSALFKLRSRLASNFTFSELSWADLVVVNSLPEISSPLAAALEEYLAAGGDALFIPSEQGNATVAEQLANRVAIREATMPEAVRLSMPDIRNPFFEGVFEEEIRFTMPKAKPVISWAGQASNVLQLQSGAPFLGQSAQVWLLASPLKDEFTDFHRHALFVPSMYKIAFGSRSLQNKLYATAESNLLTVQVPEASPEQVFKLQQKEEEIIPAQRLTNGSLLLEIPTYSVNTGFYRLVQGDSLKQLLAFNHAPEESIPEQVQRETLSSLAEELPEVRLLEGKENTAVSATIEANFGAVMLWKWTLLLALLFLLLEVLLIRFWK